MKQISRRAKLEEFMDRVAFAFMALREQYKHTCVSDPCDLCYSLDQSTRRILQDGRDLLKGMHR